MSQRVRFLLLIGCALVVALEAPLALRQVPRDLSGPYASRRPTEPRMAALAPPAAAPLALTESDGADLLPSEASLVPLERGVGESLLATR